MYQETFEVILSNADSFMSTLKLLPQICIKDFMTVYPVAYLLKCFSKGQSGQTSQNIPTVMLLAG